jgi:acyl-CoA synthetase (AMP-forming)/AMP-acid ligase II
MIQLSQKTLAELCARASAKYKKRVAFETYRDGRIYRPLTYRLLEIRARQFASLLLSLGVKAGDRALLLPENSPDWAAAFFGIALAGAVVVPVSPDLDGEEIQRAAEHAGVSVICAGGKFGEKPGGFKSGLPRIFIDSTETGGRSPRGKTEETFITVTLHGVTKKLPLGNPPADFRFPARNGGDPALVMVRGEGPADREEFSGQSLIAGAASCLPLARLYPRDRLLFLGPLARNRECLLAALAAVMSGSLVVFPSCSGFSHPAGEEDAFLSAAQALRPTVMLSDSAFIEKLCGEKIIPYLREKPLYRSVLARPFAEHRAGRKLLKQLGSSVRLFAVTGRALSAETEEFLRRVEFPLARCCGTAEDAAPALYS